MSFLKKNILLLVVFITGAAVLIVEVVAVRILSPYYGNTIFTVSSVIGVILAALSVGYYTGGKFADKHPSLKWFFGIILVSGLSVLFLQLLTSAFLPIWGHKFSIINGPLILAIVLFFLPALLLGMLSPFAVKLQEMRLQSKGIGSITGEIFFWSTLGSIFGSLFAGFVLIPHFGINQIIIVTGILLALVGLLPLVWLKIEKKIIISSILILVIMIIPILFLSFQHPKANIIYSKDGVYEKITIYDDKHNGKPTRFFQQDYSNSGAMYLDSEDLVFDYTKYYVLYKIFKPETKEALIIGGGAYSIPKALLNEAHDINVDVSEIEPSLFELSKRYFNVPDDSRLKNYVEDGRRLLYNTDKKYDLIFSDVYYSLFSIPSHFTTEEFFQIAQNKLSNDGIFVVSLIDNLSRQSPSLIFSEIKTFKEVFPNSYFFAVDSPKSMNSQNIILVGYNSEKKIDFNSQQIKEHENRIIRELGEKNIDLNRFEFSPYLKLTDNFAPVDYLTAKVLRKSFTEKQKLLDGDEMMAIIDQQLRYGPRFLSAPGHKQTEDFLIAELTALADDVHIQKWEHTASDGKKNKLSNIIGRFYPEKERRIILGAHYDSKKHADKDSKYPKQPVPGANDSASGVAVLLELARVFANVANLNVGIDIVFFDGEEGEENIISDYSNWYPLGSTYFVEHLEEIYQNQKPIGGIILDMVCDKNLKIVQEKSSVANASEQVKAFWNIARQIDSDAFESTIGKEICDDHTALNNAGIPSFLVIDFDYPPFHTSGDTLDKCSGNSLEIIAEAVLSYLYAFK